MEIYIFLNYYSIERDAKKILIFNNLPIPIHGSTIVYIHELVVRARQLASVAQLVRALHGIAGPQVQFLPGT